MARRVGRYAAKSHSGWGGALGGISGGGSVGSPERRSANVDDQTVTSGINTYDASLILQMRVGLIATFPVQDPTAENHPQGDPGIRVGNGMYLYRLRAAEFVEVRRMLLLK